MDGQQLLMFVGAGLVGLTLLGGGGLLAAEHLGAARRRTRLAEPTSSAAGPSTGPAFGGVIDKVKQVGEYVAPTDPRELSLIRSRLLQAGFLRSEAVAIYLGGRALALGLAVTACALLLPRIMSHKAGGIGMILITGALAITAIMGPDHLLKRCRKKLELEYREGFPDVLDLLVASVEAGLSLDAAVTRVSEEMTRRYPNLAYALRVLSLELRAGRSRKEAWSAFAERLGLDEARSFATMLRQAEEMGSSLGETLAVFSQDMRVKRMLRAEEKALALSAKLMLPLILFLFPCLLGVLMMPAVVHIFQMLIQKH